MMALAAAVNSFFNVFEVDNPPYLLSSTHIDEWVNMVFDARKQNDQSLTFNTSGTSGQAKTIRHSVDYLNREIDFLAQLFEGASCIIPYVPTYTIYGFLLTVGLPLSMDIPVLYPSAVNWQQLPPTALVVGTPFNWQILLASMPGIPLNCMGVSAAAPLYDALFKDIKLRGINLTELYGSTETSGIGYRQSEQDAFKLFPFWEFAPDHKLTDKNSGESIVLMDDIWQFGQDSFTLAGRKDKQVKIAGMLVNLGQVANIIGTLPNVDKCDISAKMFEGAVTLQASVTLKNDSEANRAAAKADMKTALQAHQMPGHIYFSA